MIDQARSAARDARGKLLRSGELYREGTDGAAGQIDPEAGFRFSGAAHELEQVPKPEALRPFEEVLERVVERKNIPIASVSDCDMRWPQCDARLDSASA